MPEGDRFDRTFRAGWRSAYQYTKDGKASPAEIADKLAKALAENLRKASGVPGVPEMTQLIASCVPETLLDSYETLDRIVCEHTGHRHTKVAADVAKSLMVQSLSGTSGPDGDISRKFAERVCEAIVNNGFFAKAGAPLISEGRFSSLQEFREWQGTMERMVKPSVAKIANQLIQKPDANGLRAPNRISKKKTTSELLEENLLST